MQIIDDIKRIPTNQWEDLLRSSHTRSFFQTRECYDLYAANPEFMEPFCFAVEDDGKLKGVIIGYIQADGGKAKRFFSRRAIINSGPLLADDISDDALTLILKECRKRLKGKAIYVECRNYEDYSQYKEVFRNCGFEYVPHLNFHVDTTSMEIVNQRISKTPKRYINKSFREGAEIVENPTLNEIRDYYLILKELYKTKVKTPLLPLSFFESLYKQPGIRFLLVKYKGVIMGGILCACMQKHAVYEWFVCGKDGVDKKIYPSILATYAGICYAVENGFKYFDFMGAGKPNESYGVREFKAKFGGKLVEHGRFLCVLKPFMYGIGIIGVMVVKGQIVKKAYCLITHFFK